MSKLIWDLPSDKMYETGLNRGVLYLGPNSTGVPWNGLVSVEEQIDNIYKPVYLDGLKEDFTQTDSNYLGVISAFTFPDEFINYQGSFISEFNVLVENQDYNYFGLSYRVELDFPNTNSKNAYQIHILYNLIATPSGKSYSSFSESPETTLFSWDIISVPETINSFLPTSHLILDSRFIEPNLLKIIEDMLYGIDSSDGEIHLAEIIPYSGTEIVKPAEVSDLTSMTQVVMDSDVISLDLSAYLPPLEDLINLVLNFNLTELVPNEETGLFTGVIGYGDLTRTKTEGVFYRLPSSRLKPKFNEKYYTLDN